MKRSTGRFISILLALVLVVSLFAIPVAAETKGSVEQLLPADFDLSVVKDKVREYRMDKMKDVRKALESMPYMQERVRIIVGLSAPAAKGTRRSEEQVVASQKDIIKKVENITGTKVLNSFGYLVNGFSIMAKRADLVKIRAVPGVRCVEEVQLFTPDMANSVEMTKASSVWEDLDLKGEGMVISIIDTGIDHTHKDMRISDPDSASLNASKVNSLIQAHGLSGKFFTDKIVYGYNYADKNNDIVDHALSGRPGDIGNVSMHGMHVAGIAAGNAPEADYLAGKGIRGVAPEAQLLAMKVFSNHHDGGAWSDDILMAIQDSVKLGADVINMSLGSSCGFSDEDSVFARGVQAASDAGTLLVISAGNDGLAYDPNGETLNLLGAYADFLNRFGIMPNLNMADSGSVGSSSTLPSALSVASVNNTRTYLSNMTYTAGGGEPISFPVDEQKEPAGGRTFVDGTPVLLLDFNIGVETLEDGTVVENYYDNLAGQIPTDDTIWYAFVRRGGSTFKEKATYAAAAGAEGILIWDNRPTSGHLTMSGVESGGISSVFVWEEYGKQIKAEFDAGKIVKVNTKIGKGWYTSAADAQPSSFTSWGPSPELNFKPEVAAVGGSVYSSLNGNTYGMMSGTSMSAPHTAGASALVVQAMKKDPILQSITGFDRTAYIKRVLANTATELINHASEETIHSPRRVGAGLINIYDAITTKVTVSHEGAGNIALKDFTGSKTFTLTFKNYGDADVTYTMPEPVVYTGTHNDTDYDVAVADASIITAEDTIVVPAGATKTVEFTLNPGSIAKNYVEGYLKFESDTVGAPSLSIPYLGFVGSWGNDLQIFDFVEGMSPIGENGLNPDLVSAFYNFLGIRIIEGMSLYDIVMPELAISNLASVLSATQLSFDNKYVGLNTPAGNWYDWVFGEKFDAESVGFNNDPDGEGDPDLIRELVPRIGVFRNVKGIECFITDEDDNVLRQVGVIESLRKPALYYLSALRRELPIGYDCDWDGMLYDKTNGEFYYADEGQYYYNIRARRDNKSDWQSISIPVKVDNTSPSLSSPYEIAEDTDFVPYDLSAETVSFTYSDVSDGQGTGVDLSSSFVVLFDASTGGLVVPDQEMEFDENGDLTFTLENPCDLLSQDQPIGIVIMTDYVGNMTMRWAVFVSSGDTIRPVKYQEDDGWKIIEDNFITYNAKECEAYNVAEGKGLIKVLKSGAVKKASVNGAITGEFGNDSTIEHVLEGVADGVPVELTIKGLDVDDSELCSASGKLLVDRTAPELELQGIVISTNDDDLPYIEFTEFVTVKVTDNYADGQNRVIISYSDKEFVEDVGELGTLQIPVFADGSPVILIPVDEVGNQGKPVSFFVLEEGQQPDDFQPAVPPEPEEVLEARLTITTPGFENVLSSGYVFFHMGSNVETYDITLEGTHKNIGGLSIDGENVRLLIDGTWSHDLTLNEGITYINVQYFDNFSPDGGELYNSKIRVFCDGKVPNLSFTTDPASVPGEFVFPDGTDDPDEMSGNCDPLVIWTNKDSLDVNITGSAWDNTLGYKLAINGDVVLDYYDLQGIGEGANKKDFTYLVAGAEPLDFIRMEIRDLSDFESPDSLLQKIQILADLVKPVITPYYDKKANDDPRQELEPDSTFKVEDKIVLSAEVTDEGGSGVVDEVEIIVNNKLYDGEPLDAGIHGAVFRVKDRAGNEAIVYRTIVVNGAPEITFVPAELEIYSEDVATFDPMVGVTVTDPVDIDIDLSKVNVVCDMQEAFEQGIPGTYTFTYTVKNSAGYETTATRTVRILGRPEIFGVFDKTVTEGSEFDPKAGVTAKDNDDGDLTDKIIVEGAVDTSKPATYKLTYYVYDSHGNRATATCTITVIEKAPDPPRPPDPPEKPDLLDVDIPPDINAGNDLGVTEDGKPVYQKGKSRGLAILADVEGEDLKPDDLLYVEVDGNRISEDNYTVEDGSIIIKLKQAFLNTLSPGRHVIGIFTKKGNGTKTIEIKAASSDPTDPTKPVVPSTGESSSWLLYVGGLLIVAGAILVMITIMRRRRNGQSE